MYKRPNIVTVKKEDEKIDFQCIYNCFGGHIPEEYR